MALITNNIFRPMRPVGLSTPEMTTIATNLPDERGVIRFYSESGVSKLFDWIGRQTITIEKRKLEGIGKIIFFPVNAPGVWVNDGFTYTEETTFITFTPPPGGASASTHKVAGQCLKDGQPYAGTVHLISALDETHLGSVVATPSSGQWEIEISSSAAVYAFVSAPYGVDFVPSAPYSLGDIIHPTAANGYIYEVLSAGNADGVEPSPWLIDGNFPSGSLLLAPKPYPAPQIHGPIKPIPI